MSNISKISTDIKKKLSFKDYDLPPNQESDKELSQQIDMPTTQNMAPKQDLRQEDKPAKCHAAKETCRHRDISAKTKSTFYLNSEAEQQFTDIYINRLKSDRKIDRSALICEAIKLLFKNEEF